MTDLNYVRHLSEIGVAAANVRRDQAPHGFWHCCVVPLAFRAPPGPAAACARGRRPAREPSAPRASLGASPRSPARPRRRPRAPQPGPPNPPAPSIPVGPGVMGGPARRLEARPCPAAAHRHCSAAPLSSSNFARNSPETSLDIEVISLELHRFRVVSKSDRGELCAKFVWRWPCERVLAQPTGRSLHRGRVLWFLRCLPLHTCGAWSVVVLASSISASRSVQNSPCSVFC